MALVQRPPSSIMDDILRHLVNGDISKCGELTHDLVQVSWDSNDKVGVHIGDNCQGVFSDLESIKEYPLASSNQNIDDTIKSLSPLFQDIQKAYESKDIEKIHKSLMEFRYIVTNYSLMEDKLLAESEYAETCYDEAKIEKIILDNTSDNQIFYPLDFASKYNLDFFTTMNVSNKLVDKGVLSNKISYDK